MCCNSRQLLMGNASTQRHVHGAGKGNDPRRRVQGIPSPSLTHWPIALPLYSQKAGGARSFLLIEGDPQTAAPHARSSPSSLGLLWGVGSHQPGGSLPCPHPQIENHIAWDVREPWRLLLSLLLGCWSLIIVEPFTLLHRPEC